MTSFKSWFCWTLFIRTEGALSRPLTYDNHPSKSNTLFALNCPERHKITLEELGRPPVNQDKLRWTKGEQWQAKKERPNDRKIKLALEKKIKLILFDCWQHINIDVLLSVKFSPIFYSLCHSSCVWPINN